MPLVDLNNVTPASLQQARLNLEARILNQADAAMRALEGIRPLNMTTELRNIALAAGVGQRFDQLA